jgi:hypothetical protein
MSTRDRWKGFFFWSAGAILIVTAVAKVLSSFGDNPILREKDPIAALPYGVLLPCVAVPETAVACVCLFAKRVSTKARLLLWLACCFAAYRASLVLVGYHGYCHCLGELTEAIGIPQQFAQIALRGVLAYFIVGSSAVLMCESPKLGFLPRSHWHL